MRKKFEEIDAKKKGCGVPVACSCADEYATDDTFGIAWVCEQWALPSLWYRPSHQSHCND